ncbi:MAG: ABC transporter permease [Acidaminococcaceae bacterium]|nr:ABC transporter permease [Acidaminococcaceae bacterium]
MKNNSNNDRNNYICISPDRSWTDLRLDEVWRYRDLIFLFTKRYFALTYAQTILGPLWLFLKPFLTSIMFTLVFGYIAGIQTDGVPKFLFFLCGTAVWNFFSACVSDNAKTFIDNASLFGKVYFPRLTVPVSKVTAFLIRFLIQISMVLIVLLYYCVNGNVRPHFELWIVLPLLLLQLGLMGMGVGIIISSLTTKYRDLSVLVEFGIQLWMYGTPVVYPLSQLPQGWMRTAALLNPVTAPVELFRLILLGEGLFSPASYLWSLGFTVIVTVLGVVVFNHVEKTFLDTV